MVKIKRKGMYCWKTIHHDNDNPEISWHQNHSAPIISMAAEANMVEGKDIEQFIKSHEDKHDFMLVAKVPRSSKLVMVDEFMVDKQLQNICRYYVSNEGGEFVKIMPPIEQYKLVKLYIHPETKDEQIVSTSTEETRYTKKGYVFKKEVKQEQPDRRIGINIGWKCKPCNNILDFDGNINYDYYINEAKKLIVGTTPLTECNDKCIDDEETES